jgi:hypothetical protein
MLRLSNEVLLMIHELLSSIDKNFDIYGNKEDLFASRAVCRRLADLSQSLAFKCITFIQDEEGYKRLLKVSKSPQSLIYLIKHHQAFYDYPMLEIICDQGRLLHVVGLTIVPTPISGHAGAAGGGPVCSHPTGDLVIETV